jgi:hypothetical protein
VSGQIARYVSTPPRRIPAIGQVLELVPGDVKYVDEPTRITVSRPRPDISRWHGGDWVWVHAEILGDGDELLDVLPLLRARPTSARRDIPLTPGLTLGGTWHDTLCVNLGRQPRWFVWMS